MNPSTFTDAIDWDSLTPEGIELDADQFDRATQLSQSVSYPTTQWQVFLNALALYGFEQWLEEWAPDLDVDYSQSTLFQPVYKHLIEVVCNVVVGPFRLGLVVVSDRSNPIIDCSKAALELPAFIPDFYVLIEVLEEGMQVQIYGYQRRDQLLRQIQLHLAPSPDWLCPLSLSWFNLEPTSLLLELQCLEPEAIPALEIAAVSLLPVPQLQTRLVALISQLQNPDSLPNHFLTWEEGATILSHPEIVQQLDQIRESGAQEHPLREISSQQFERRQTINVAAWLRDRLDTVAQELSWVLMPLFTPATAELRSNNPFAAIQVALAAQDMDIPSEARGAYQDLSFDPALRLYAVTWMLPATDEPPQWTLLLVLGTVSGESLPLGVGVQMRAAGNLLASQMTETAGIPYLYTCVVGDLDEQFQVTVMLPIGATRDLPPFAFEQE